MGAVLLSPFYILLNFYLISRMLLWFRTLHSFLGTPWFVAPFLLCYILLALSPLAAAFGRGKFKAFTRTVNNFWLGILMYLLIFLLMMDLGRILACFVQRRSLFSPIHEDFYRITGGIVFASVILISTYGILHATHIKKTRYEVALAKPCPSSGNPAGAAAVSRASAPSGAKIPDMPACKIQSLRIALVADLHLGGSIGLAHMRRMKQIINGMNPDLIVFAGDIFDNDFDAIRQPREIAAELRGLTSTYGSVACWGNHDVSEVILAGFTFSSGHAVGSDPRMEQFLKDADITLLEDQVLLIDGSFYLCGRLDASCQKKSRITRLSAQQLLAGLDRTRPVIVVDHQPSELDELAKAGADLVLSGHTHDGQLFPGNLTTYLGWKNACGRLQIGHMTSIVTSGVGIWGPAMRVGTDSEVVEIEVNFRY